MSCSVYCVSCSVCWVSCSKYFVSCSVYCVRCSVYCVSCSVYCVSCSVYCVSCSVFCVSCSIYYVNFTRPLHIFRISLSRSLSLSLYQLTEYIVISLLGELYHITAGLTNAGGRILVFGAAAMSSPSDSPDFLTLAWRYLW